MRGGRPPVMLEYHFLVMKRLRKKNDFFGGKTFFFGKKTLPKNEKSRLFWLYVKAQYGQVQTEN